MMGLPRGVWYEAPKDHTRPKGRYRVRLYKNGIPYLRGYYDTVDAAIDALMALKTLLNDVPELPKRKRGTVQKAPVPGANLADVLAAIRSRQHFDTGIMKRRKAI